MNIFNEYHFNNNIFLKSSVTNEEKESILSPSKETGKMEYCLKDSPLGDGGIAGSSNLLSVFIR